MNNQKPLVSILLPVHNCEEYLSEAVESLFSQSYSDIEIVAIDDKSCDNSLKILRSLKRKDKRLKVYQNVKRYGIVTTLNRALKRARGQFITVMDASDICSPKRIKKQINFLMGNPDVTAVGTQCVFIDGKKKRIGKSEFPQEYQNIYASPHHGISVQFETILINKLKLPKDLLNFNINSKPFIYSDLLMKLLSYGKFANLNDYLHYHRNHPDNYLTDLKKNIFSLIKLWIKSITNYDYGFSVRSFFAPLIKSV